MTAPPKAVRRAAQPARVGSSSDSIDQARFTPGTMLTERYRIVGMLGKGGMGEVYRADDLKLRQSVALKFLPAALSKDSRKLERFHHEVRVARQVSHPNVCRVYDIGEADGQHFISMEYVDGEDLASVLRRMGRPSTDKAVQIARQLCAGLAAAHDKGVLHRDLKPHNVMIDGSGKVRVTDFGLAGFIEDFAGRDVAAGTPAYMAPEQLAGREVSVKSDVYALGLVLYELFTGQRLFEGTTRDEIGRLQTERSPSSLSTSVEDIDPAVERVILRCLEREPSARPSSALAVAAALPGGDPLAAALAAGETPDPEMVAAAGGIGGLTPTVAVPCLIGALVVFAICIGLRGYTFVLPQLETPHPPEVLANKARELIASLGHPAPFDFAFGFTMDRDRRRAVESDTAPDRWDRYVTDDPSPLLFWYRQSPRHLVSWNYRYVMMGAGRVSLDYPRRTEPGMASVILDPQARLLRFEAVPPQFDESPAGDAPPNWSPLFEQAGLDPTQFSPTPSNWSPPTFADTRAAWMGHYPHRPDLDLRVEAAAYKGRPVYFELVFPWTRPYRQGTAVPTAGKTASNVIGLALFLTISVGSFLVAMRNLRLRRGDRRGAGRLAAFVSVALLAGWVFGADHVLALAEIGLLVMAISWALFGSGLVWLLYVALEPYVRRRWPQALISWSRLLTGHVRDPLVGRDILLGTLCGSVFQLLWELRVLLPALIGTGSSKPMVVELQSLNGAGALAGEIFTSFAALTFISLGFFFFIFLLRVVLRRVWLAAAAFVVVFTTNAVFVSDYGVSVVVSVVYYTLVVVVLLRFGLLVLVSSFFVGFDLWFSTPVTHDLGAWYAGSGLLGVVVIVGLAVYGFHTALAGRPLFKDALLES